MRKLSGGALYDTAIETAMIICKEGGCENGQGGALYDTAMIICKGGCENGQGFALYETAMMICKGVCENGRGVHYMTQE